MPAPLPLVWVSATSTPTVLVRNLLPLPTMMVMITLLPRGGPGLGPRQAHGKPAAAAVTARATLSVGERLARAPCRTTDAHLASVPVGSLPPSRDPIGDGGVKSRRGNSRQQLRSILLFTAVIPRSIGSRCCGWSMAYSMKHERAGPKIVSSEQKPVLYYQRV